MDEKELINNLITLAFAEDIGEGDHTTLCSIAESEIGQSRLLIKEKGTLAGVSVALEVFCYFDPELQVEVLIEDGSPVKSGDVAFIVSGKVRSILQTERIVLNIMQRMSGIATTTRAYMNLLEGTSAKVLDTRKTTPGMRLLEKKAVKIGGGENHRIGLFDMILLKDNHIDFAGGIENAIRGAQRYLKEKNRKLKIEIEVRTLSELKEVIRIGGVDRIMLDNFTPEKTLEAVKIVDQQVELESSGGITRETIRAYAETGVNFISVGALTHSVRCLDMSLKAV